MGLSKLRVLPAVVALAAVGLSVTLYVHAVDNALSEDDKRYLPLYMEGITPPGSERTYEDEVDFIRKVQHAVLRVAPIDDGLPFDQRRGLKQLYEAGKGLCYDRSRVIEKILRDFGFKARHMSLYPTGETGSAWKSLLTAGIDSHAVTEVMTSKGWLVVDSNDPWMSLDGKGYPVSIEKMRLQAEGQDEEPATLSPPNKIYTQPFVYIYGLYSRHGHFYPPYDFIPDINYSELMMNVF